MYQVSEYTSSHVLYTDPEMDSAANMFVCLKYGVSKFQARRGAGTCLVYRPITYDSV
jgi:hypothetical protein